MRIENCCKGRGIWSGVGEACLIAVVVMLVGAGAGCATETPPVSALGAKGSLPKILATVPAVGALDVDPGLTTISITFDRDMAGGFSWTGGGEVVPKITDRPRWMGKRTCELPVSLVKGRYYRIGINSSSARNFRAEDGPSVSPIALYFCTKGVSDDEKKKVRVPKLVSMSPKNGAKDVSADLKELRVTFDVPMGGGMSWTGGGETFPGSGEKIRWSKDKKTCTLPAKVAGGKEYRVGLNSLSHINFQSQWGVPFPAVAWRFSTVGDAAP